MKEGRESSNVEDRTGFLDTLSTTLKQEARHFLYGAGLITRDEIFNEITDHPPVLDPRGPMPEHPLAKSARERVVDTNRASDAKRRSPRPRWPWSR